MSNDLRKGDKILLKPLWNNLPRVATIMDNKKGITRDIQMERNFGYHGDYGSTYIDEFTYKIEEFPQENVATYPEFTEWFDTTNNIKSVAITEAHQKKLKHIRAWLDG